MELQKYEQEHLDILRPLLPECTVLLKKKGAGASYTSRNRRDGSCHAGAGI